MQTKLLLAALAAISSRTANAKKDGDRVDSVGEKLVEIYERCKLHIEGNNFQITRADEGQYLGRVSFHLEDADGCPELNVTVKTYVENADQTQREQAFSQTLDADQVMQLLDGETIDLEIFSGKAYAGVVTEIRASPKDLDCGLPFDLVFDRIPMEVHCNPTFKNLQGTVHCVGDCNESSTLVHSYNYDIDPKTWDKWACQNVIHVFTPSAVLPDDTLETLGEDTQPNEVVKAFMASRHSLPFETQGTFEPIHWQVEFFDQGEKIGHLETDLTNPHVPCQVNATGYGTATPSTTGFELDLNVRPTMTYTCRDVSRQNTWYDGDATIQVDECEQGTCHASVTRSLLYEDLPAEFDAEVEWFDNYHGGRVVGTFSPIMWEGENECIYSINDGGISSERRPDLQYSQQVKVQGDTGISISCPKFTLTLKYLVNDRSVHTESFEVARDGGAFETEHNIPEFFGSLKVLAQLTPEQPSDLAPFDAHSNVLTITPEACNIQTSTTAELSFNRATSLVEIQVKDLATYTEHWCLLDRMEWCVTEDLTSDESTGSEVCYTNVDSVFGELFQSTGYVHAREEFDHNFCYHHSVTVRHDASDVYPRQQTTQSSAELEQESTCNIWHCQLHSVDAVLSSLQATDHPITQPNYEVELGLNISMQIDALESCPDLMSSYKVEYSADGENFDQLADGKITDSEISRARTSEGANKYLKGVEEHKGYYRVCVELQEVTPNLYEKPLKACSNVRQHVPQCEFQTQVLANKSSQPDEDNTYYNHALSFEGFQNKWCGEMVAQASVTDPWFRTYTQEVTTNVNAETTINVVQDHNFINGEYTAEVQWSELDSGKNESMKILFDIVDAGNWCQPSLDFEFHLDFDEETEKWDQVDFYSYNGNFTYYPICEKPRFTVTFEDKERSYVLPHLQELFENYGIDETFTVASPTAKKYTATLTLTTDPANGATLTQEQSVDYVPLCNVYGVYWEKQSLQYGVHTDDPTALNLNLRATVEGNCGDNVSYRLQIQDSQFDSNSLGEDLKSPIPSEEILEGNLDSYSLNFDSLHGHYVDINYVVEAVNAPRKTPSTRDNYQSQVTVADMMRCVVRVDIEQVTFGEDQQQNLVGAYDLKCLASDCHDPVGQLEVFNEMAPSSGRYSHTLRPDELADCIAESVRVPVSLANEPGCYRAEFQVWDRREPAEDTAELPCVPYTPKCHTGIDALTKVSSRLNFDETMATIDFNLHLKNGEDRFCGFQTAEFQLVDQYNNEVMVHQLDITQIKQAQTDEGLLLSFEVENLVDTTYSVNVSYADESNTDYPAKRLIPNVFSFTTANACQMEVETFTLESLVQIGSTNDYEASFELLAHVTEACRDDFQVQINFIHNDEFIDEYVLLEPEFVYRIQDDGTTETVTFTVRDLTDLSGEFYGQIEMTANGQYHIRDSASLSYSWA